MRWLVRLPAGFADLRNARPTYFNQVQPMALYPRYHDIGQKTVLGGTVIPAGQTGTQDLDAALDNIFNHPNVGPFIAIRLIRIMFMHNSGKGLPLLSEDTLENRLA